MKYQYEYKYEQNLGKVESAQKELEKALEETRYSLKRAPNFQEWRISMETVHRYVSRALSQMNKEV
jgi:tyrosine-protein phosphatase YwqE